MPVVVSDGTRQLLTVLSGENATEVAEDFCIVNDIYNVSEEAAERLVNSTLEKTELRKNRTSLVTVPVNAADGRTLQLEVRQGDQHDLFTHASDFALAMKVPPSFASQLADIVAQRLPEVLLYLPVNFPGRRMPNIRIGKGDNVELVVKTFCEVYSIDAANVPNLVRAAYSGIHPTAPRLRTHLRARGRPRIRF